MERYTSRMRSMHKELEVTGLYCNEIEVCTKSMHRWCLSSTLYIANRESNAEAKLTVFASDSLRAPPNRQSPKANARSELNTKYYRELHIERRCSNDHLISVMPSEHSVQKRRNREPRAQRPVHLPPYIEAVRVSLTRSGTPS